MGFDMVSRLIALTLALTVSTLGDQASFANKHNDFSCRSAEHPNPVVMVPGLYSNDLDDVRVLEDYLKSQGFCTFSTTYGAYPGFPLIGGVRPMSSSAPELADFVRQVQAAYPGQKVDMVGHSEGGMMVLYMPKMVPGMSEMFRDIIAIAPTTHGTTASGTQLIDYIRGPPRAAISALQDARGCPACDDISPNGPAVEALNNGPIRQPGNFITIIASKHDKLVTPAGADSFVDEPGVRNLFVQQFCPQDQVGHVGLSYDPNVFALVKNTLSGSMAGPAECQKGMPF